MASSGFVLQMQGYGLTTANILYRLPDHPGIIQSYIWQKLKKFLDFWARELDGRMFRKS